MLLAPTILRTGMYLCLNAWAAGEAPAPTFTVDFGASVHTSREGMYWCQGAPPDTLSDSFISLGEPKLAAWRIDISSDAPTKNLNSLIPLGDNRPGQSDLISSLDGASHVGLRLIGDLRKRTLNIALITSRDPNAEGKPIGHVTAEAIDATTWNEIALPLPTNAGSDATFIRLSFDGDGPAWVAFDSLQLIEGSKLAPPTMPVQLAKGNSAKRKALWVWETRKLLADKTNCQSLLELCKRQAITDLYFQIPYTYDDGVCTLEFAGEQRDFNTLAAEHDITMHALDGHPKYIWAENHPRMFALVDALAKFNSEAGTLSRYRAVHLDNEPYVVPEWRDPIKRKQLITDYLALNAALKPRVHDAGMAFGLDIPHWFETVGLDGESLPPNITGLGPETVLHKLMPLVDNLGIMSYRERVTGPNGVVACCLTEFALGQKYGVEIYPAVELGTGPNVEKGITLGCYSPRYAFSQIKTLETALRRVEGCTGIAIHYDEPLSELERQL